MINTISQNFSDIRVMTKRNVIRYLRLPRLVVFSSIQPVMFLLLFVYVFGGAIKTGADKYINFLLPGIILQSVLFGSIQTGIGLAEDLHQGIIDRFRALPMARSAVLAGRTISDMMRNIFVVLLMALVGLIIGYRFYGSFTGALASFGLAILFGFAFSWISATIGLLSKDSETAQVSGFIWVFPLAFASSIFVPVETMPLWLEAFARYSPISLTVDTVRAISLGVPVGNAWWQSLLWIAVILTVFVPLGVRAYRKSV